MDVYCQKASRSEEYRKLCSQVVQGAHEIESLFGGKHGDWVKRVHLSYGNNRGAEVVLSDPATIELGADFLKVISTSKPGTLNPIDELINTGRHETVHSIHQISIENKAGLIDLFHSFSGNFLDQLSEGRALPALDPRSGHAADDSSEFLASFLVVATHRLGRESLKLKTLDFQNDFRRAAKGVYDILRNSPEIKSNAPIFSVLKQFFD
jgi:hypothetical protein